MIPQILDRIIVKKVEQPVRLSDFLVGQSIHLPSRKSVKKACSKGLIQVNGKIEQSGYWVQPNDEICILQQESIVKKTFHLDLEVLFEDEFLAVIRKPAGYPVSGNYYKTIQNALPHNLELSSEKDALSVGLPIHRLDKSTSGLLIIAKTKSARIQLGKQLENNQISKIYQAIVMGVIPNKGVIQEPIDGKDALTYYEVKETVPSLQSEVLNLIECKIETGRTHQIRKHFAGLGNPILGDDLYGEEGNILKGKGLFLCATRLAFKHPKTDQDLAFNLELPHKFKSRMNREKERFFRLRK